MSNHKSAMKRARQSLRRKAFHNKIKGRLRALEKTLRAEILKKDKEKAKKELSTLLQELDKAHSKGLYHKNKSARKKSRLTHLFQTLN